MRTIEVKEINVSTKQGRLDWLEYKNNPEWSFLAETGTIALFEKIEQKKDTALLQLMKKEQTRMTPVK